MSKVTTWWQKCVKFVCVSFWFVTKLLQISRLTDLYCAVFKQKPKGKLISRNNRVNLLLPSLFGSICELPCLTWNSFSFSFLTDACLTSRSVSVFHLPVTLSDPNIQRSNPRINADLFFVLSGALPALNSVSCTCMTRTSPYCWWAAVRNKPGSQLPCSAW